LLLQGENSKGSLISLPKPAAIPNSIDQFRNKLRLPHFAKPRHYELRFHPNSTTYTFSGLAAITVNILEPTHYLVLNVVDLTIDHASIYFKVYNVALTYKQKRSWQTLRYSS
jgi:hypothetical protein